MSFLSERTTSHGTEKDATVAWVGATDGSLFTGLGGEVGRWPVAV